MDQKYFISLATFSQFEDVSVNIEPQRMNVFIKKAQELDLKPFLGAAFYYDLYKNLIFDENGQLITESIDGAPFTPQKYVDLYRGAEYTDSRGHVFLFSGIIPALVYFTFARFIEADSIRYTATGPVVKHHDQADPLKPSEIAKIVTQQRSVANAHTNDIIAFLSANRQTYTLWGYNERNANSRQPGPRIRGIDRTQSANSGFYNGLYNGIL